MFSLCLMNFSLELEKASILASLKMVVVERTHILEAKDRSREVGS